MITGIGLAVVAVLLVGAAAGTRAGWWPAPGPVTGPVARALGLAGLLTGLAAAVFVLVAEQETLDAADAPVLGWLVERRTPGVTTTAEVVSLVGGTVGTGGLAVLVAVVLALRGRRVRAAVWVAAVAVGSVTIRGLKVAVERPRPPEATRLAEETTASLPSGHSLMAALGVGLAVLGALTLLRDARAPRRPPRVWTTATVLVGVLVVAAIGASRVYLGVHWTTDVVAGWSLGAALAALATAVAVAVEYRRAGDHPPEGVSTAPLR